MPNSAENARNQQHQQIVSLLQNKQIDAAKTAAQALIDAGQADANTFHLHAYANMAGGDYKQALVALRRSIALDPAHLGSWSNLGVALRKTGDIDGAIAAYQEALHLAPDDPNIQINLYQALAGTNGTPQQRQQALAHLGDVDNIPLALAACHFIRQTPGVDFDILIDALQQILACSKVKKEQADAHHQLGLIYSEQGEEARSEQAFAAVLALDKTRKRAHLNYAVRLFRRGDYAAASHHYDTAIELDPHYEDAYFQRGQLRLLQGDFAGGWSDYDWRLRSNVFSKYGQRAGGQAPLWDGSPLQGKTLLIHAEQGLGDSIQFLRFVPSVPTDGGHMLLEVQDALAPLLHDWQAPDRTLIHADSARQNVSVSVQLPLLSLARLCNANRQTLPGPMPYLRTPPATGARWQKKLAGSAERAQDIGHPDQPRRIGLVWAGNPHHLNDHNRSLQPTDLAALIDAIDRCCRTPPDLFSLQLGAPQKALAAAPLANRITDLSADLTDFGETAGALDALDLIISVDTAVAHLAGALNRPLFLLLPLVPDWRWLLNSNRSPWYPSARLFRQNSAGDWRGVFEAVATAVANFGEKRTD